MLLDPLAPTDLSEPGIRGLIRYASKFFLIGQQAHVPRPPQGRHKFLSYQRRSVFFLITRAHEIVGHRAIFSTLSNLREGFGGLCWMMM